MSETVCLVATNSWKVNNVKSLRVLDCIFIVLVTITNMNRLFLISGIAVFVAAISLITNTPNTTMAYSCSSSAGVNDVGTIVTSVSGSSGSCSTSASSAGTSQAHFTPHPTVKLAGPNESAHIIIHRRDGMFEYVLSTGSGGSQSSCSSSSFSAATGSLNSTNISQPGTCP
jgi:hypothetical protein